MKKTVIALLFTLLVILQLMNDSVIGKYEVSIDELEKTTGENASLFAEGSSISCSNLDIHFNTSANLISVEQEFIWINRTSFPTDSICLSLPLNAFRNPDTDYIKAIEFSRQIKSGYNITSIKVNGINKTLTYIYPNDNKADSTIGCIKMDDTLLNGDSVRISMEYSFRIPQSAPGFGYSKGEKFCLLADWHPYIVLFKGGKWLKDCFTRHFKPEAEPMFLNGNIMLDADHFVSSSADLKNLNNGSSSLHSFTQDKGSKVTFAFYREVLSDTILVNDYFPEIELCLLAENERYHDRIKKAFENTIGFLIDNIGPFPFKKLSAVNVPNNTSFGFSSHPSLLTFYCDLISPEGLLEPEFEIMRMLVKQYYQEALTIPDSRDKWIAEGIPTYLAGNISNKYYSEPYMHFKFAGYFPIFGLNLLSYNEIPIIYTLNDFPYDAGLKDISDYFSHINSNPIVDSRFRTNEKYFKVNQSVKPAIILKSLENTIGEEQILSSIRKLYSAPVSEEMTKEFIEGFKNQEVIDFLNESFLSSSSFDYKLDGITSHEDGVYEVNVSRSGSGTCPVTIYLYTESDTLITTWDGTAKNYRCIFRTDDTVLAAEVDPGLAGILDLNKANNSYTVQEQYWGSISIVVRAFFWFQNALMIFGSIG